MQLVELDALSHVTRVSNGAIDFREVARREAGARGAPHEVVRRMLVRIRRLLTSSSDDFPGVIDARALVGEDGLAGTILTRLSLWEILGVDAAGEEESEVEVLGLVVDDCKMFSKEAGLGL